MGSLKSNYQRAVFLWIAMVGGIFIYLFLVELFKSEVHFLKKDSSSPEVMPIKYFLLSFTTLTLFLIWFVRRQILRGEAAKNIKSPSSRLLIASVATHALCETVAITALTLFLLTRNPFTFYPFLVLSLILFSYFFPRYPQWEEWAAEVEGLDAPVVWVPQSLFPRPEFYQGGAPAPGLFAGQPEGSHLRQPAQDGMHRSP
jgi:hypothetical protein